MKLLWLCNSAPGVVRAHISGKRSGGVNWVDHVLSGLRGQGYEIRVLYRGSGEPGVIDETCSYAAIPETPAHIYVPELEERFREEIRTYQPQVIHSWGVEYHHALAMVNAAEAEGMLSHTVASIQGLCGFLAEHYTDGLPENVQKRSTFRDYLRKDNILQQKERFVLRGELEKKALGKLQHVIGRTDWDRNCALALNPNIRYHFCNETLRDVFYGDRWNYGDCRKHRVFASSCSYPVKGFHYLLEAFGKVVQEYPDATLTVTGRSYLTKSVKGRLRRSGYEQYLAALTKKYRLEDRVVFLGDLSAEQMKQAFLDANVFALTSTLENSPNALGEAMVLGMPCVAANVGGVRNLMTHETEGFLYESGDVAALARGITGLFAMEAEASGLGQAARSHALATHDPETNLRELMKIYDEIR